MKKAFLLIPLLGFGLYLSLSSNKTGYGSNVTGSHGGTVGCTTCHGSAQAGVGITIELDSAGTPVTRYKAGKTYTLKVKGVNHTTATNLAGYGGQLSIVSGSGTSSVNAGTLSSPSTGTTIRTGSGSVKFVEHTTRLSPVSGTGDTGTTYEISATWTAPTTNGTGTIKAYGIINAVNCNNNDGSGDYWNSGNASFTELLPGVGVEDVNAPAVSVYPNPVSDVLNLSGFNGTVKIYTSAGRLVATASATGNAAINTSSWAAGMYLVVLEGQNDVVVKSVIKQ